MPTYERADLKLMGFDGKCTARRHSDGAQCRRPAARGANVCPVHGGSAPQVRAAAKRRLEQAADALAQRLLGYALNGDAPDHIALIAIRDALDRAGLSAKTAVELSVAEPKPYEEVFGNITGIATLTREESRAQRGLPTADSPALEPPPADVVDAEVVDGPDAFVWAPDSPVDGRTPADTPDSSPASTQAVTGPPQGLVSFEEAVTETQTRTRVTRVKRLR